MSRQRIYKQIKSGLEKGIYKTVRLVRIENGNREVILPFSGAKGNAKDRFEHLVHQLEKSLPVGLYEIEAKAGFTPSSIIDSFKIELKNPVTISIDQGLEKKDPETMRDSFIDVDDYKDLLKEISDYKSLCEVQKMKIQFLESQLKNNAPVTPLAESPSIAGGIFKALEDHLPTALNVLDTFLKQRDRGLNIKERELTLNENGGGKRLKIKRKSKPQEEELDREAILEQMQGLSESDPDSFEATLDEMEEKNPELYDFICDKMDLMEEEEEEGNE